MSQKLIETLIKCLIDTTIFLEFSNDNLLNEDNAIKFLEELSYILKELNEEDRHEFSKILNKISGEYPNEIRFFIQSLPETLGIET